MRVLLSVIILFISAVVYPQQMIKLDGSKSALLMEVGAVVTLENKKLVVSNMFGKEMRKEENKKADIQKGDEVLYINGTRVSDPKELRKIYEEVKTGGEIKLGIDRKGNKFFVTFKKDDAPAGVRTIIKSGPDGKMRDEKGNEIKGNVFKAGGKNINIDSLSKSGKVKVITK